MARHNRMRMEWTLASCRTPRSTRKDIEDIFHKPGSGSNRVSKPKSKKSNKPPKKTEIKGSWDHTGDDSSQIAEGEGNDSEDGSDDSADKPYVKGPALTSRGHLKGRKHSKKIRNKKTGSAGPISAMQAFSRQKASSLNRIRDQTPDDTPTKKRSGAPIYAYDSDSDCSSLTMDLDIDDDDTALNEYNIMISDTEDSDMEEDDDDDMSDEIDELDEDEMDELDDDDQSIIDEETEFIIGMPPPSDDGFLEIPSATEVPNSPSALSEDSDDENEDIYMDMDDPVVQKIMNHSYTICDDENEHSDDMLEPYFSDEASDDSDYDSDATIYDVPSLPSRSPTPTPVPESIDDKTPTKFVKKNFSPPKIGFFKPNPDRLICIVENIGGLNRVLTMTVDDYTRKADGSNASVTTPGEKASEELFAYLPSQSQYSTSIPSEDWDSASSFNKNWFFGSEWDEEAVLDAALGPQWTDYIVENLDTTTDELLSSSIDTISVIEEERITTESSPIRAFSVPVTAFRANQNNALSRSNSIVSGIHTSGIKKNAPRKDSSLTPSQRRKSDATHPGRNKTPTPPIPFPVPLEPLFADTPMSVNPASV
ncbi:hypothetical protein H072_73 [Dactylellina haptotyla CBS 200.50]|uniref:Uncharacterized protein n=1 Tax=Dactylellina haptotyla (strain CBS 200.50) TaxID=1284197 RepID=S8CE60_DACHA|nr:hypothetical protein H072_73 [Dactylellina haptotyla CBS 200.50]